MKLNKTLGEILYSLYGPNSGDLIVHRRDKRRYAVLLELKRHGLVELKPHKLDPGLFVTERRCRGLGHQTDPNVEAALFLQRNK